MPATVRITLQPATRRRQWRRSLVSQGHGPYARKPAENGRRFPTGLKPRQRNATRGLDGAKPICLLRPNVPTRMGAGVREEMGMMLGHNRKMLGAECMADMLEAYGVTHVFHVPAVLRKTFAVMETRAPRSSVCTFTARRPRPIWLMATRARPASPASAWRR